MSFKSAPSQDKPGVKGSQLETHIYVVGYHLKRLHEPVFMAGPKPLRTDFGIHQRLESCGSKTDFRKFGKLEKRFSEDLEIVSC